MIKGRTRKILIALFTMALLVFSVVTLSSYLSHGTIVVTSSYPDATIVITTRDGNTVTSGSTSVKARVHTGTYTVAVQSKTIFVRKVAVVASRKTVSYTVSVPEKIIPEPVISGLARNLAADQTNLNYYDPSQNQINTIDQTGTTTHIAQQSYDHIEWADTSYGVAQSSDGGLFVIQNNATHSLELPSSINKNTSMSFALTKSRQIYIASGKNIYLGSERGNFKKIYTSPIASPAIFPGNNKFAIIGTDTAGKNRAEITTTVAVVTNSGDQIKKISGQASDDVNSPLSATWSPNGNLLAITNLSQTSSVFSDSLEKLSDLPVNSISSAVWQDDDHLFFGADNNVWSYDQKNDSSGIIASITDGSTIHELVESSEKSYLYVATAKNNDSGTLFRLGLKGQQLSDISSKLGVFLPESLDTCFANYVNLVRPVVVLHPYKNSLGDTCKQAVINSLQNAQIDTNQLTIVLGDVLTQSD